MSAANLATLQIRIFAVLDNNEGYYLDSIVVSGTPVVVPEVSFFAFGGVMCGAATLWSVWQAKRRAEARN